MKYTILGFIISLILASCHSRQTSMENKDSNETIQEADMEKPNILWLSVEDLSPRIAAYGDSTIATPHIDRLAREGVVYENMYCTAGVCAPSRNAIITGRYQTSNGGHNMRTLHNTFPEKTGLPKEYQTVPPPQVRCFPEYLKAIGYYTTNNDKTDYQFTAPPTVWDENGKTASWRNRPEGKPFFSVINFNTTHESQIWKKADNPMRADPKKVLVPPFYPDNGIVRNDIARQYSNVSELDDQIGEILKQLEADGLMEKTIIFFWTDHGDGLPFYKREVYRRGIHVPLIVRFPDMRDAGIREDRFISTIDLGPSVLSLAGVPTPMQMQGIPFLGPYASKKGREYIFAARDRLDSEYDRVRSVLDTQFQYVRNFSPEKPLYMDIAFRKNIPTMRLLLEMRDSGTLNAAQGFWFQNMKPIEELYDWREDPYQLNNLAENPDYLPVLERLREQMDAWIMRTNDLGGIPEKELLYEMWNGEDEQPITAPPVIFQNKDTVKLMTLTTGASIAYRKKGALLWEVYQHKRNLPAGDYEAIAMRIGYKASDTLSFTHVP